ncbi:MAG TPA: prepilin-type N-terminal cleavage/methylation domain-containing protein [Smithellaceae bacterium]|jgi:prepilin-type N-terminal cleavage/methylation domain-containing protein|nr:MAG: hypothetical protein BWX52_01900 [Bacteroidetes bacterium ADurb.Bin013]HOE23134.1 prepilin-type N-terminal cleavage/methylation domain-containing protein [Smithellaceae bacterium]HOG91917.1 prepilin-type N-terminal cleavage/methylation domain-containing protein [Smithella sp.]HOR62622.1 prepilin-type N-terminal cleavage/methylation domain-containing protein [Smithellaceae bacterium]HOU55571.1 prepilin-type N-terminal cleavage/methylation domain-containing protein [Smithellaceae bacteriu
MKGIKHNIKKRDRQGFTLLEVLIAMFILTVAILALVSVTVTVIKGNASNKMVTTATTLAKDQLETLKNDSLRDDAGFNSIATTNWAVVSGFPQYERRWTVTTITGNTACTAAGAPSACCKGAGTGNCPDRKNVTMEVRWSLQGSNHNVTLKSILIKK